MQRGTLEKSPSEKSYKQTVEFVQQLKPLKDRYKTEMLKNKLAALSTSPVKKSLPNLKAKSAPYHVDYSAYQKVFEPGEKSQHSKPKRSFMASLETSSHIMETESVNSSMISKNYNIPSPTYSKHLLSPLKSQKSTRPEDFVVEPLNKFKLEILNMLPVRSIDFSSAKSSSLMSSPEKKKSEASHKSEIKQSRLQGVLSKKPSASQIEVSPSSSFLGSNLFHLSQIDFESPKTELTVSDVSNKSRPVLKKLHKGQAQENSDSVHMRMRSLHISPKAVLDTGIEADYEEDQKYQEMDFVNKFVYGFSRWQTFEKQKIWKKCRILDYNPKTKKFLIEWEGTQTTKEVFRRNLIFENESPRDYHAKMETDFQQRVDAFTNKHFRGVLQSQARKRDEVLFPKNFLLGIMKKFENMHKKLLKKGIKPNIQPFLDEVYQTFKYSGELCTYNANHDPKKLSLETVLNKMKIYQSIGKTLYTELKVIYTIDPTMKDKLESDGTQILKIDNVQRYDKILDTETFTTKLNTFEKIFIHQEAQVQKEIFHISLEALPDDQGYQEGQLIYCLTKPVGFSKVLSTLKNKKFQTMFNPQIKESLPLYNDFIKAINCMNGLENIELFEPFCGRTVLKQKHWTDAAKELNDCFERIDIQVYRVEKQLKEFLDNVRLSAYHRKEIEQRGREIQTIVKCANIKIEEEIIKGTKASFSNLLNHLNSFSTSLDFKMKLAVDNKRIFPKCTDNIHAHKEALLSNLRNLKIKLHNKSLAIDGRDSNLKGAQKRVLFETKLGLKKVQSKKSDEQKKSAEFRFMYRKKQRNLFYNGADAQNLESLLLNYLSIKDETMSIDYNEFTKDLMYNGITKDILEWVMPNKRCKFKYKPSLEAIETFMKKSTAEALSKILGFQKINYFLDAESSSQAKPKYFKLTGIETEIGNFSAELNNILLNSFYKPSAFLILIEPFRFYSRDLDYFEKDIKEFLNTGAFEKVMDELHALQLDMRVCKLLLPDFIESGIMIAQVTEVKAILTDLIEKFSEKLITKSLDIFVNVIHETEKLYEKAWETMKPQNKDIETYIKLYDYVRGSEYKKILEDIEKRVVKATKIYEILEEALYHLDFDLLTRFYQMRMSSGELKANSERLLKTLQGNRAKYEEQLNREKAQLERDFEEFFEHLDSFENFDDVYKYFSEDVRGRIGTHEFAELIKKTERMNTYREKLELEQKDLKEMLECFNLWEYCENMFNTLQSWENSFIKEVNLEDMKRNFERKDQVVPRAYEFFTSEDYPDINEFIRSIEDQILIFEEYYYLVSLLKNEAFNDRYWDKLIQTIWKEVQDEFKLPRQKDLIFKNLLAKDLLSHKQTIIDLFQEASQERTLDLELSILAESMREIPFVFYKLGTYGGKVEIILIENIVPIREKLEELKRSCNKYQDLSKNFKQVLDKMQKISITVDVLLKFFEELENMQSALCKSFPFIGNNEFLETLDDKDIAHLQKTVLSIEEALRLLKLNGFEDLIQICENIINKDVRKKGRDLAEFGKSLEKVFRFGEKKIVLQNLNENILRSLETYRKKHPRLYFLQDYIVAEMVSNEINPIKYLRFAQKAFDNLKEFKLTPQDSENDQERSDCFVEGLVNCLGETFALPKGFQVIKGPGVGFISELERQVKFLIQLDLFKAWKEIAAYRGNPMPLLKMFLRKEISSQSMFLSNEASFFFDLSAILQLCSRSPFKFSDFFKKLIQTKNLFIQEVLTGQKKTENDEEIFQLACKLKLIQQEKHFIDILTVLSQQESLDELKFEYLSLPKLIINSPQTSYSYDALLKTSLNSADTSSQYGFLNGKVLNLGEVEAYSPKVQVFFECVDAKINYGFELASQNDDYYLYPLTDHYLYQIATSLSSQTFPLLYNLNTPALTLQLKRIASHLGRKIETIDFCDSDFQKSPNLWNRLAGIVAIGGWLIMPSFENCELTEFSQLAEYVHAIKEALFTNKKEVVLNSKPYSISPNFCVLGLPSSKFSGPNTLSCSLLEHYRLVHLEIPSFEHILENLMYCFGDSQSVGATIRAILAHDEFEQEQNQRDLICGQLLSKMQHMIIQLKGLGEVENKTRFQQEITQVIRSFFEKRNHSTRFMEDLEDFFAVYMGKDDEEEGVTDRSFGDVALKDFVNKALDEFVSLIGGHVDEELQDHIREVFLASPIRQPILLYGDVEEDVWLVIRAWCYIYASIQKHNFHLLRLPLDAMDDELFFGNYRASSSGVLEFLNKVLVPNSEQINSLSRFCKYPAIPAANNANSFGFTNLFTTVIFDSNHLEENTLDSDLTKTLITSHKNIFEVASSNLAVFYKLKDIHNLDLTHISATTLSYVPKKPFSVRSEHVRWLNTLNEINTWFSNTFEELENLKNFILYPLFNKFILRNKTNLSFDDRSLFKIFTEYLQIFLNELRKYALLTHGYNPFAKTVTPETTSIKQFGTPAMNSSRRSSRRASGLYTQQVDAVMNSEKVLTLVKQMENIRQLQDMTEDHQMSNRSSISKKIGGSHKKESRISEDLQCIYIQSLTLSIGSLLKDKYKPEFEDFLVRQLHLYSQSSGKPVARGLLSKLEEFENESSLLNCYYDFAGSQWVLFSDYNPSIKNTITPSFVSQEFSPAEKARFLMEYKTTMKHTEFTSPNQLFLTSIKKKACFILDHLISYDQNVLFIASTQQGKSIFLDYFAQFFDSYKLVINNQTTKSQLITKLSTDFKRVSQASTQLIYIDDVHLQDEKLNPAGVLRSALQLKGLYNHKETRFIPTPNLKFLLSTSFSSQAVLRSNFVKYFKYQGGPLPFYMDSEESSDLTSIFNENIIQKSSIPSISSFSEGLFEYFNQTKSTFLRLNNRFETNLTYPAILSLLQSLQIPLSEDYSAETIDKILKTSLNTLFVGTPEHLNKYANEILGVNLIPNPSQQQLFTRKTSRFKSLVSEQNTRREVDSLTSPLEIKRLKSKDTKTTRLRSVSIRPILDDSLPSTRSRKGTFHKDSDVSSEAEKFDPSLKNFIENYLTGSENNNNINSSGGMIIQEFTKKKLKLSTDIKDFGAILALSKDQVGQKYLMYLLYIFQTFSSNLHFLALPHKNPLVVSLVQCISDIIPLVNGVYHNPTDLSPQDQVDQVLCDMSTKATQTHFLLVDFKTFSNQGVLREFLQNLNALIQGESLFSLLGAPRASKIIATWKSEDLTDIQTLKLIQKEIKSRFRLVLLPCDGENPTLDELKQHFPNLFSQIFYISPTLDTESSSAELDSILNKMVLIESKLEKDASLKIASKLHYQKKLVLSEMISSLKNDYMLQSTGYLDIKAMRTWKLSNSQDFDFSIFPNDVLLKCCFTLKEKSLGLQESEFEKLLPKILSFAGLSSVFASQYPFSVKTHALRLIKKDLGLDTVNSLNLSVIFKNEKFYHQLYSLLSKNLFASDQLCDDLMSMHLLLNHTKLPAIYAYDPLGIISLPLLSLLTSNSITEISKDNLEAVANLAQSEENKILLFKDITEEEYLLYIHKTLKNLNQEKNRTKFIFLFSSQKPNFFDKFDTLVLGIDLDATQADHKNCIKNMLIYQKEQKHITEKLKQSNIEVFSLEENLLKIANDCPNAPEQVNDFLKNRLQKILEEISRKSQPDKDEEEKIESPKPSVSIQIKKKELMDITTESTFDTDLIFNSLPKLKKELKEWANLSEYLLLFKQIFNEIIKPNTIPEPAYLSLLKNTFVDLLKDSPKSLSALHFEFLQSLIKTACQWVPKDSGQLLQSMLKIITQLKTSHHDYEIFWNSFMKDKPNTLYKYKFSNSKISNIYEKLESFISLEGLHWRPVQQILDLYASDKANLQNFQPEGRKSPSGSPDRLESQELVSSAHVLTDPYLSIQDTQDQQRVSPLQKQAVPGISPKGSVFNKAVKNVMAAQRLTDKRKSVKIDIPISPQGRRGTLKNEATSPIIALNQIEKSPKTKVNTLQEIKNLASSNLKHSSSPSGILMNDFSFSNVFCRLKGTPIPIQSNTIIDKSHPSTKKALADTSLEQYYSQYFSEVTHPAFKNFTQQLSDVMTGVFTALENAKSFDLKQFFLQDGQSQPTIYDQISPLAFLFLIKALRPDLLQSFWNDSPLGKESLETTLLQNPSLPIAIVNNSETPRLQEALQLLLQLSKIKISTFLPKNYNQDAFFSAINIARCIFLQEAQPPAKVAEAIDMISSLLKQEKKPAAAARVIALINQKYESEIYQRLTQINPYSVNPLNSIKEFMTSLYLPEIFQSFLKPLDSAPSGSSSKDNTGRSRNFISASVIMDSFDTNSGFQDPDPKFIDKNQFTLHLLMSIYYFRQKMLGLSSNLTLSEIYQMGKKLMKLSQAIPGDVLINKLSQRSTGSTLNKSQASALQYYAKKLLVPQNPAAQIQTQQGTLENIDNVNPSQITAILNSLLKAYPLISGKALDALQPSDVLSVLTNYPDQDIIEVLSIGESNKTLLNLEKSEKYSEQLQKIYKGIQDSAQNLQSLQEDFTNLWNSSANSIIKRSHEGYRKNLTFIKGLYQVISNIEDISTRFEIDQDMKREPDEQRNRTSFFRGTLEKLQIDSLVLKSKDISKPSLFQGTQRNTELEKPVVLSDQTFEEKWIRKYVKEEVKKVNKLVERIKKDLLCITANLQENSQNENWNQLLKTVMENQVPEKWASKTTISSYAKGLTGFLEVLIQRYEYFDLITKKFKHDEPSSNSRAEDISKRSIDLDKFSDPTEVILDYLVSHCIENDLEFKDIEAHLLAHKEEWVPEESQYQPTDGIYLKGLKLNHGNYNVTLNELQEASPLQILQLLPDFRLTIRGAREKSELTNPGEISIFVNTESKTIQSAMRKKETERFDLGKIEEMLEEEEENDKEKEMITKEEIDSRVKIDFKSKQDISMLQKSKLVFCFNSKISQEVWACKSASIGI